MTQIPPPNPLNYQVPPTFQQPLRPTSVTVIAIFVIIFASIGILCSPFGLIPWFSDMGVQRDPVSQAIYGNKVVKIWTIAGTLIGFVLAIINLIAAINALKLKRWSREAMIKVAIIQLVLVFIGTCVSAIFMVPDLLAAGKSDPAYMGAAIGGLIGAVGGLIFGSVLPVLTIIFFRKPHVIEAFEREPGVFPSA